MFYLHVCPLYFFTPVKSGTGMLGEVTAIWVTEHIYRDTSQDGCYHLAEHELWASGISSVSEIKGLHPGGTVPKKNMIALWSVSVTDSTWTRLWVWPQSSKCNHKGSFCCSLCKCHTWETHLSCAKHRRSFPVDHIIRKSPFCCINTDIFHEQSSSQ